MLGVEAGLDQLVFGVIAERDFPQAFIDQLDGLGVLDEKVRQHDVVFDAGTLKSA